jgi:hypothetical protein
MRLMRLHHKQYGSNVAKRKRAKGAGRKPKGEFHGMRNPLSIRIPDGLREKLDGACKGSGRSLTQEVTRRLNDSFAFKAEPDPFLRAIQYLIGQATLFTGKEWKTNPWTFQAFRSAVSFVLERFAPPGELTPPETAKRLGLKIGIPPDQLECMRPEGHGFVISSYILRLLTTVPEPPPGMSVPDGFWPYAMPHARKALGVPFDESESIADLERMAANMKEDTP